MDVGAAAACGYKEFGVRVWATDLWIPPTEHWTRIRAAGLEAQVAPIHANARQLPFAHGFFFDAVVCVDAYIYFGTDDLYLTDLVRFLAPGSQIGMVSPGFARELDGPLPEHLRPFWAQECWSWPSVDWWRRHWGRTGLVDVERSENLPEVWELGRRHETGQDAEVVAADRGAYVGMIRTVARTRDG